MIEEIKEKISIFLKQQADDILHSDTEMSQKLEGVNIIFNLQKILDNYDELEPILKRFFNEKQQTEKWRDDE